MPEIGIKEEIEALANDLGLMVSFSSVEPMHLEFPLPKLLANTFFSENLGWSQKDIKCLEDLTISYPWAKTLVSFAQPYSFGQFIDEGKTYARIAPFCAFDWYGLLKEKLKMIKASLLQSFPPLKVKTFIEGKILEKNWAEKAGLGNRGKNSLIFLDRYGSRVLFGEILLSAELKVKQQVFKKEICEGCSLCLEACPTKALCFPYMVRPDLCLDYFSLHYDGIIPLKIRQAMGMSLFGCSLCQEVCPLNKEPINCEETPPGPGEFFPLERALTLKEEEFRRIFQGHTFRRVTFLRFQRNALIAAGNSREQFLWDLIYPFVFNSFLLLRQHAFWSLWMINPSQALPLFHKIRQKETDPRLLGEIEALEELTRQDGR